MAKRETVPIFLPGKLCEKNGVDRSMTHKEEPVEQSGSKTLEVSASGEVVALEGPILEAPPLDAAASQEKTKTFWSKVWGLLTARPAVSVPLLMLFALLLGLEVGFSLIGKGGLLGIFSPETWTHMFNLVFG